MARKRRGFNLRRVRVATSLSVGALATLDVSSVELTAASANAYRVISTNLSYSITDVGATIDDGQEFGLAHSDYTTAEVEEAIEAGGSVDIGDKVAQEQANRLVRTIGMMAGQPGTGASLSFNDGRRWKTKLNWHIGIGKSLRLWVRNGSDTVYTDGANLVVVGDMWVKDL